jgi:hypothetical protein
MRKILSYKEPDAVGDIKLSAKRDVITIKTNGETTMELNSIKAVGIANLGDVTEHHITTIVGSRSHLVRFANGGELQYAYNAAGQLIDLTFGNLLMRVTNGNEISFGIPHDQPTGDVAT